MSKNEEKKSKGPRVMKGAHKAWKDVFLFRIYDLARDGHNKSMIAKVLGVSQMTIGLWIRKKPLVQLAFEMGRNENLDKAANQPTLSKYIYNRLPRKLKKLWKKINALDGAGSGIERVEALLSGQGKLVRQHLFLYAWTSSNFSISTAMRKIGVTRAAFDRWTRDPDFLQLIEEIQWHKKNFFEDALLNLIARGDSNATIFAHKSQNKDRGYGDKLEIDHHVHGEIGLTVVDIDNLKLPLNVRKMILQQFRESKQIESKVTDSTKMLPAGVPEMVEAE